MPDKEAQRLSDSSTRISVGTSIPEEQMALPLEFGQARELTDRIKAQAEELWHLLLEAYERGAHKALGYPSWGAYFETEFGGKKTNAYQLLDAGRVVRAIGSHSANAEQPNEAQARELAPLAKSSPEEAAEVWEEVTKQHGDKLTATDVRQAVTERVEFKDRLAALPEQTRAVLEQADEGYDKHRNLLRNSNQMNHLANIADKHGDEVAAEVAERALTEERSNAFKAYEVVKEERALADAIPNGIPDLPPFELSETRKAYYRVSRYLVGLSRLDPGEVASECESEKAAKKDMEDAASVADWFGRYTQALSERGKLLEPGSLRRVK